MKNWQAVINPKTHLKALFLQHWDGEFEKPFDLLGLLWSLNFSLPVCANNATGSKGGQTDERFIQMRLRKANCWWKSCQKLCWEKKHVPWREFNLLPIWWLYQQQPTINCVSKVFTFTARFGLIVALPCKSKKVITVTCYWQHFSFKFLI